MRGGTAHCMVVISDREIGSPYIDIADTLIIMNGPSLDRFRNRIKKQGLFIVNGSLATQEIDKNVHILKHPFTDIAVKLGNIRVANMVALGCLINQKKIVDSKSVLTVIRKTAPADKQELIEINERALEEGMRLK